jgi:YHS domain-containing protein
MKISVLTFTLILISCFVLAQKKQPSEHFNLEKKNIALKGYDPVSYFKDEPKEGKSNIASMHDGILYYFSNQENKTEFEQNPGDYVPQYGGWCAYAMGVDGSKVDINPETYKIVDGKLYLFYNKFFQNTKDDWNQDEENLMQKADQYWQKLMEEHQ